MTLAVGVQPRRPLGVTVLSVLEILTGIIDIVLGILVLLAYAVVTVFTGLGMVEALGALLLLVALAFVAFGIVSFILAYGLWKGLGWAWLSTLIIGILGLIFSVTGLAFGIAGGSGLGAFANIIPVILYALILAYLYTPNVRIFFGRGPIVPLGPAPMPPAQPAYSPAAVQAPSVPTSAPAYQPTGYQQPYFQQPPMSQPNFQQPPSWAPSICPSCGTQSPPGANFCDRCGTRLR